MSREETLRRRVLSGLLYAAAAGVVWGVGNVVTRWTAQRYPASAFDVTLLKYAAAATVLLPASLLARGLETANPRHTPPRISFTPALLGLAFAKGVNTYLWIVAAALIPAGTVAILENTHVLWASLAAIFLWQQQLPFRWILCCGAVVLGATFVLASSPRPLGPSQLLGVALALVSAVALAVFLTNWTARHVAAPFWFRALEMSLVLALAAVVVFPLHLLLNATWLRGPLVPLTGLSPRHAVVQTLNGLVGIGITYLLVTRSAQQLGVLGARGATPLALGMSLAIPTTQLGEAWWFAEATSWWQWLGVVLFIGGFTLIYADLQRPRTLSSIAPDREELSP